MKCLFFIFIISLLPSFVLSAEDTQTKARLGFQIYVTFDKPWTVDIAEGIRYSQNCEDKNVCLDLYYPNSKSKFKPPYPCILIIHGGGWSMGNEKKFAMMAAHYAQCGYLVACTTYRLLPKYRIEDCIFDAWSSLKFLKENAEKYGGNPNKIGVIGGSAGGHLTGLLATASKSEICKEVFSDTSKAKIQAAVSMAGVSDFLSEKKYLRLFGDSQDYIERAKKISPLYYVDKNSAPMLFIHSKEDTVVPLSQTLKMVERYEKVGVKYDVEILPSSNHAFWNVSHNDKFRYESWERALAFFDSILKK